MNRQEASTLIQSLADSIRNNPSQFTIEISVNGTSISNTGGTGLSVTAYGGMAGSNTVGFQSTVSGNNFNLAPGTTDVVLQQKLSELAIRLQALADEVNKDDPNVSVVHRLFSSIKEVWVPGVIISVVGNVLTMALNIHL